MKWSAKSVRMTPFSYRLRNLEIGRSIERCNHRQSESELLRYEVAELLVLHADVLEHVAIREQA
jgi:hypothetical protein